MDNKENKMYRPTQAIQNNAIRGINLLKQSKSLSAESVLNRTSALYESITKSECSLDDVKKLYVYLVKAEESYDPMKRVEGGGLTAESAAFLAAGGTSALAWSRMILKQAGILKSYRKEITEEQINKEDELKGINLPISKAVNEELMQVTYVVMIPEEADMHGDETSIAEVRKACHNFNQHCMKANLFHMVETDTFSIIESYIAPVDFILNEHLVKAGTWLCTLQVTDDTVWSLIKSGEICAVSIGAVASVEVVNE
ncbi:putative serine protease [Curvibacter phage P26059A]|nr:putative serine protease [Curvibacter phage P26059A]